MPAKKAPAKTAPAEPTEPTVAVTVTGAHAVDGVAPGGRLHLDPDRDIQRIRRLMRSGHVTVTVNGEQISDRHIVARMEGA